MALQLKNRYGIHQPIHIGKFHVDRKGIFSGEIELHVTGEDFDKPNFGYLRLGSGVAVAGSAGIIGVSCVGIERSYDEEKSHAVYTYSYEGVIDPSADLEFELDITMTNEPIETHPNFEELNRVFGPYQPLTRLWPRVPPKDTSEAGLAAANDPKVRATNPMFGITSFLSPSATYRLTRTRLDIGESALEDIGTIVQPPHIGEAFPELDSWVRNQSTRTWLKLAPRIRKHGKAITITEEYMLSGWRGWIEEVYNKEALQFVG